MTEGLVIDEETMLRRSVPTAALVDKNEVIRLRISERRAGKILPLLQRTKVLLSTARAPTMLSSYWGFLTSVSGWSLAKQQTATNDYKLPVFLSEELGFDLK